MAGCQQQAQYLSHINYNVEPQHYVKNQHFDSVLNTSTLTLFNIAGCLQASAQPCRIMSPLTPPITTTTSVMMMMVLVVMLAVLMVILITIYVYD